MCLPALGRVRVPGVEGIEQELSLLALEWAWFSGFFLLFICHTLDASAVTQNESQLLTNK
jgi:hypothetical protein